MAKLYFHYATMSAGKSAVLLQASHNYTSQGMRTLLMSSAIDTRSGENRIASRIGIEAEAASFSETDDLYEKTRGAISDGDEVKCLFVDEAQFLSEAQVIQLTKVVDDLGIPVMAYGLRTDFQGNLFPGSEAMLRFADEIREVRAVCFCGRRATMILRLGSDGKVIRSGEAIAVGGDDMYRSVCRKHWFQGKAHE